MKYLNSNLISDKTIVHWKFIKKIFNFCFFLSISERKTVNIYANGIEVEVEVER